MNNIVMKFDKQIATLNETYILNSGLSSEELEKVKLLIIENYDLNNKRNFSIKKHGYVPNELISSLSKNNHELLYFKKKGHEVTMFSFVE